MNPVPTLPEILSALYPEPASIRRILDEAQMPAGQFALGEPAINVWSRAIERARDNQQLQVLMATPLREFSGNADLRAAWDQDLVQRRASVSTHGGDTAMSLMIDLLWDTRGEVKEVRQQVSDLRHESRNRLTTLELMAASMKAFQEGQAADIEALQKRPSQYSTQIVLALALLAGALGGLFAAWGRMAWANLVRLLGG